MLALAVAEDSGKRSALASLSAGADTVHDDTSLESDLFVIDGLRCESAENDCGFFLAVLAEQPTRTLGKASDEDQDDDGENALEGDRESPGELLWAVETAVVDPAEIISLSSSETNAEVGGAYQ